MPVSRAKPGNPASIVYNGICGSMMKLCSFNCAHFCLDVIGPIVLCESYFLVANTLVHSVRKK